MAWSDALLEQLKQRGVEFRLPELLWAVALVPLLLLAYVGLRASRAHVDRAFRVRGARRRRSWRGIVRGLSTALLWLGLAAAAVGFARPVMQLPTPNDAATVVVVVDASLAMRATDVNPTRFDAAKAAVRAAVAAVPERAQVALVAYSASAYVVQPPTHDHGAVPATLGRVRTAEGASLPDALAVALAVVPVENATPPPGAPPGPRPKAPAAVVLVSTGDSGAVVQAAPGQATPTAVPRGAAGATATPAASTQAQGGR